MIVNEDAKQLIFKNKADKGIQVRGWGAAELGPQPGQGWGGEWGFRVKANTWSQCHMSGTGVQQMFV